MRYTTLSLLAALLFALPATAQTGGSDWQTVATFEGSAVGNETRNTATFTIDAEKWRARWQFEKVKRQLGPSLFQVNLKQPGEDWDGSALASVANEDRDRQTTYQYEPGTYYLEVSAMNADWELVVQKPPE